MLKLIMVELKLLYWQAALRQMGAAHPDVPMAVLRIRALLDAKAAWGMV